MAIYFNIGDVDLELKNEEKIKNWIKETIFSVGKQVGNISYVFCSDEYLLKVNIQYLNHDTYTDIITFDYVKGNLVSGDILISINRVEENAKIFYDNPEEEEC